MEVKIIKIKGTSAGSVDLNDGIFARKAHPQTINDVVKAQLENQRLGTNFTKTRGQVAGGGKKPWRQKGTGRARCGSNRSPLWVGGATTFGPKPKIYDNRPPKKIVDRAISGILSEMAASDKIKIVEDLGFDSGKTKDVVRFLSDLKIEKTLIVVPEISENTRRAAANLKSVKLVTPLQVNAVDLLKYENLAISDKAVKILEEELSK